MLTRFFTQPNKDYRNFQIVCGLLALQYLFPSISYMFMPQVALAQAQTLGRLLGGGDYPLAEQSYIWRVLAAGNVFTLSFMCVLLLLNVRRFYPVVPAFVVLKGFSALGYLYVYLFQLSYPLFLGVFVWDGSNVFFVLYFAGKAFRSLKARPELLAELCPRLRFTGPEA